jgi:rhamnosyltransferase subunit B
MANILLTTMWAGGDVLPFVRIAIALKARGHETTLITHCNYEEVVKNAGVGFLALDNEREYERFIKDGHLFNSPQGFLSIYQNHVLPKIVREYDLISSRSKLNDTIIIARSVPGFGARLAAEKLGIPLALIFFGPSYVSTMPLVEELVRNFFADEINRIRSELGLAPATNWESWLNYSDCNIGLWPEWFARCETDWPVEITLTGFLWFEETTNEGIPINIGRILENDIEPILITGGTSTLAGSEFFYACTEACRILGRKGILVSRHAKLLPLKLSGSVMFLH